MPWDREWERPRDWDHPARDFDDRHRVRPVGRSVSDAIRDFDPPWEKNKRELDQRRVERERLERERAPPPRELGRDQWPRPQPGMPWSRGTFDREPGGYGDFGRSRVESPRGWYESGRPPPPEHSDLIPAPGAAVSRKRENDGSDRVDYSRDAPKRDARSSADDKDWKRRKIDSEEVFLVHSSFGPCILTASPQFDNQHPTDNMSDTDTTGRRRTEPSEPSQHVIFLGLDPDATEADVGSVCLIDCL